MERYNSLSLPSFVIQSFFGMSRPAASLASEPHNETCSDGHGFAGTGPTGTGAGHQNVTRDIPVPVSVGDGLWHQPCQQPQPRLITVVPRLTMGDLVATQHQRRLQGTEGVGWQAKPSILVCYFDFFCWFFRDFSWFQVFFTCLNAIESSRNTG